MQSSFSVAHRGIPGWLQTCTSSRIPPFFIRYSGSWLSILMAFYMGSLTLPRMGAHLLVIIVVALTIARRPEAA